MDTKQPIVMLCIVAISIDIAVLWRSDDEGSRRSMLMITTTAQGVCGDLNVTMLAEKVGCLVKISVPYFMCDGTANASGDGIWIPLPTDYHAEEPSWHDVAWWSDGSDVHVDYGPFVHVTARYIHLGARPRMPALAGTERYGPFYAFELYYMVVKDQC